MTARSSSRALPCAVACAALIAFPGCGNELKQAEPVGEGGSQDDGGPITTLTGGMLDGAETTSMMSGGGSDDGTTMAGLGSSTSDSMSTSDSTSTSDSADGSSSSVGPSGCRSDTDCQRPTSVCDVDSGECVDCLGDRDCEAGVCDEDRSVCVECMSEVDCTAGVCTNDTCVTLGYDCLGDSNNCNDGEQCCGANQCAGACMIPCGSIEQCPDGMGCEHGWCLFACDDDDGDCAAWPGYTCQHGGVLCEAD